MNQELEAAIELGRTLRAKEIAEYEQEERQREYARRQEIMLMWAPYIAAVRSQVPKWATVSAPLDNEPSFIAGSDYDRQYRPMSVDVGEGIPPLRAWTNCTTRDDGTPTVKFTAGFWKLYCPEDTGEWIVVPNYGTYAVTSYQIRQAPGNEFYLALAEAAEQADLYPRRLADAKRHNEEAKRKEEVKEIEFLAGTGPMPIDPMERIANALEVIARYIEVQATF